MHHPLLGKDKKNGTSYTFIRMTKVKHMKWRRVAILIAVVATTTHAGIARAATEVNTCGQVFSGSGFLSGDLDCTGFLPSAVTIQGGTLDLAGFTLTGGPNAAVFCEKSCKIVSDPSGGMITGAGVALRAEAPFTNDRAVSLRVQDTTIEGNGTGIDTENGGVVLVDSTLANQGGTCVSPGGGRTATVLRSTITNCGGIGVSGRKVKIRDSTITGNNVGVNVGDNKGLIKGSTISGSVGHGITSGSRLNVKDSEVSGNGGIGVNLPFNDSVKLLRTTISSNGEQGVKAPGNVTIRDATISSNALEGVFHGSSRRMRIKGSAFANNGIHGIAQDSLPGLCDLRIVDTTATGNGTDPDCGVTITCADIASCNVPTLAAVTCDTSYDIDSGFPGNNFGVCALD